MNSEERIKEILVSALRLLNESGIDQGEILYWETALKTVRTYLNRISLQSDTCDAELYISSVRGNRPGQSLTSDLTRGGIERAVKEAVERTALTSPYPFTHRFPGPHAIGSNGKKSFFESTLNFSAAAQLDRIDSLTRRAIAQGLESSVKLMAGGGRIGIINSSGTLEVAGFTDASLSLVLTAGKTVSAYSSGWSGDIDKLDSDQVIRNAIQNAKMQRTAPAELPVQGDKAVFYDLILEPFAVAEWLEFLALIGLNGLRYEEGESFVSGKIGEKILGSNITIADDATDPRGIAVPFDFEGVPKRRQILFENGVARSVCYDSLQAGRFHKKATGHALAPDERAEGAYPRHLVMEGGRSSIEEMIASSSEPTLYVTRFHYTNVVNPHEGILTGMTKDGTFLIQNGKMVGPVANQRFLESIPEALNRVSLLGRPQLVRDPVGYSGLFPEWCIVPPVKIEKVRIIGSS